jgi:hypothetical protein
MPVTVSHMFIPVHDPDGSLGFDSDTLDFKVHVRRQLTCGLC